ncbi:MAG: HD domain-containing protein, partial [Kiritimatiellae bacterium]|nr:HD domain-containing protein [Kiritimatiellia bacterium]
MNGRSEFSAFFRKATGFYPYQWQEQVARDGLPEILNVPTGFGKTEGTVLGWAWRRLVLKDENEPLHLIYCLPMRTLVRQTVDRLSTCFENLRAAGYPVVPVFQLMGGAIEEGWTAKPEEPWVLVGTQDQLLSRALNRGYSMSRYEWPVHFGLLNQDCRWVFDEVQLMGPGLWTSAQLDWMRRKRFPSIKPCLTTWMSATLSPSFLATQDRKQDGFEKVNVPSLRFDDQALAARRNARRRIQWLQINDLAGIAGEVLNRHERGTLSLVVCNTVETAQVIFQHLPENTPKILLTSRFRRQDRESNEARLLEFERRRRQHPRRIPEDPGLICISTQVVEAGLDVSAHHLWSELAPWPSVIQRLGRLNRDGEDPDASAWFWQVPPARSTRKKKEDRVGPYPASALETARDLLDALSRFSDCSFSDALERLARALGSTVSQALQPELQPMPRAMDVHGLYATEPDVHGGFTDISAFVRSEDPDADVTVIWREWSRKYMAPPDGDDLDGPDLEPDVEGCPVAVSRLRDFLQAHKTHAWIWNEELEQWERLDAGELSPGMVIMLHRESGGYDSTLGWTGNPANQPVGVARVGRGRVLRDDRRTEAGMWVPLSAHLRDAKDHAEKLCTALGIEGSYRTAVVCAAALHDIGKAHPQWQRALPAPSGAGQGPWAKSPPVLAVEAVANTDAIRELVLRLRPRSLQLSSDKLTTHGRQDAVRLHWAISTRLTKDELETLRGFSGVRWAGHVAFRPGLRHEAASALAMWHNYRNGNAAFPALAVYLAAAHHGKVRTVLRSLTEAGDDVFGLSPEVRQITVDGVPWLLDFTVAKDGAEGQWDNDGFLPAGFGWTALVADLLGPWNPADRSHSGAVPALEPVRLGPFVLAYLEALVRVADWRASADPSVGFKP